MPILTAEERVGTLLAGRYRLESILGSGGTAVVYSAHHAWTGRSIALKLLKPEHARDRELVMRFLREARTASTIVHPNVVTILDMGTDPSGDVYLAMELLEGESLGAQLEREGAIPAERAIAMMRPVMEALSIAHARGIVHRDIKPDNVLIGDRGDGVTRPILLDFGMAKMTEAAWGHATQSGLIIGTPFYMSPEQAEGASDLGPASDVWSMGVLLYRCIAGTLPFFASAPTSLLLAIVRGDHVPLRERAPHVPLPIAAVIERALCVDRAERYADMNAMIEALDRAVRGETETVPLRSPPRRSPPRRSDPPLRGDAADFAAASGPRRGALAAIGLLLVVLGLAGYAALGAAPSETIAQRAPPADVIEREGMRGPARIEPARADVVGGAPVIAASPSAVVEPQLATTLPAQSPRVRRRPAPSTASAQRSIDAPEVGVDTPELSEPVAPRRRRGLVRSFHDTEREATRRSTGLATEW